MVWCTWSLFLSHRTYGFSQTFRAPRFAECRQRSIPFRGHAGCVCVVWNLGDSSLCSVVGIGSIHVEYTPSEVRVSLAVHGRNHGCQMPAGFEISTCDLTRTLQMMIVLDRVQERRLRNERCGVCNTRFGIQSSDHRKLVVNIILDTVKYIRSLLSVR